MTGEEPPSTGDAAPGSDEPDPASEAPSPEPAAEPEQHETLLEEVEEQWESDEPGRQFRLVVAVLIAMVSVMGATVAWSASTTSNKASDLNQSAQQDYLLQQQILTSARASIGEDLRRVADFQEEVSGERILRAQADTFRRTDPAVAAILDQQAQGQAALARTTGAAFIAATPTISADGTIGYNQTEALDNALSGYVVYQQLHPAEEQASADKADRKYKQLVAVGVLLVVALFFLTVAEFGRRRVRHLVVVLGAVALIAGCVLWPLAQTGSL